MTNTEEHQQQRNQSKRKKNPSWVCFAVTNELKTCVSGRHLRSGGGLVGDTWQPAHQFRLLKECCQKEGLSVFSPSSCSPQTSLLLIKLSSRFVGRFSCCAPPFLTQSSALGRRAGSICGPPTVTPASRICNSNLEAVDTLKLNG